MGALLSSRSRKPARLFRMEMEVCCSIRRGDSSVGWLIGRDQRSERCGHRNVVGHPSSLVLWLGAFFPSSGPLLQPRTVSILMDLAP